ncbi:hypothetical protein VYU27_008237, partial [Nannochloropsis oceanica]
MSNNHNIVYEQVQTMPIVPSSSSSSSSSFSSSSTLSRPSPVNASSNGSSSSSSSTNSNLDAAFSSLGIKAPPSDVLQRAVALLRDKGNEAFRRKRFLEAIDFYGQALAGAPDDKTLYANRCLARLKKEEGKEGVKEGGSGGKENSKEGGTEELLLALADAERALQLDPSWLKGCHRKAVCLYRLGKWKDAKPYLVRLLSDLPDDRECQAMLKTVLEKL